MKLNNLMMIAAAAALGFTACNKEDGAPADTTPKTVSLSLGNVKEITRNMQAPVTEKDVTLKNFCVFFTDGEGNVLDAGKQDDGTTASKIYYDLENDTDFKVDDKLTFHFLPSNVSKVVVVGNVGDITRESLGKKIDAVLADVDDLVIDGQQDVDELNLYGTADLVYEGGDTDNQGHPAVYTATVRLAPRVSRIEVTGFAYNTVDGSTPRDYTAIDVTRVAFAKYYYKSSLSAGTVAEMKYGDVDGENVTKYLEEWSSVSDAWYYNPQSGIKLEADAYAYSYSNSMPTYNFFVNASDDDYMPQLVVGMIGEKGGVKTPLTLITKSFSLDTAHSGNGTMGGVGKVYKVNFVFNDRDFTNPQRCVELTVDVMDWAVVYVTPNFR